MSRDDPAVTASDDSDQVRNEMDPHPRPVAVESGGKYLGGREADEDRAYSFASRVALGNIALERLTNRVRQQVAMTFEIAVGKSEDDGLVGKLCGFQQRADLLASVCKPAQYFGKTRGVRRCGSPSL